MKKGKQESNKKESCPKVSFCYSAALKFLTALILLITNSLAYSVLTFCICNNACCDVMVSLPIQNEY